MRTRYCAAKPDTRAPQFPASASDPRSADIVRAALTPGAIEHVLVINLENENYSAIFSATSPATYLNGTLLRQGELIPNYFATSHVSLGNYISQVYGQGTNPTLNCLLPLGYR